MNVVSRGPHVLDDGTMVCRMEWRGDNDNDYHVEYFEKVGQYHFIGGPAVVHCERGTIYQVWFVHNKRHRVDGPAEVFGDDERYYVDDVELTREQFEFWSQWYHSSPDNADLPWSWGLGMVGALV